MTSNNINSKRLLKNDITNVFSIHRLGLTLGFKDCVVLEQKSFLELK